MTYCSTSQCHMNHLYAQIYFVTSYLNLEALALPNLFSLPGKKRQEASPDQVILGNTLEGCIKSNVEF